MSNSIERAKKYVPMLDEVYAMEAKTAVLDAPAEWLRETANADTILIPSVVVDGLGDYDRNGGFVAGSTSFSWESHTFEKDRGRSFTIDSMDDEETINMAVGATSGEFMRTKVIPEVDAYRFAKMATVAGIDVSADLTNQTALEAIDTGFETLSNAEVAKERVIIFVSPTVYKYLKQSGSIVRQFATYVGALQINREIEMLDNHPIIEVPQTRFYSAIDFLDGSTTGEEAGGYAKSATAKDLNFVLVDPQASQKPYVPQDVVRYTFTTNGNDLSKGIETSLKALENEGYEIIKVKNTWYSKTNAYRGVNTNLRAPNGIVFEVQYHTPESFELKNGINHKLYEKWRLLDEKSDEAIRLNKQMFENSSKLTIPKDIADIKNFSK